MNWHILWAAPWFIQVHAIAAIAALGLGIIQVLAPKGTLPHRTIGVIWVVLMTAVTISSIFIQHDVGPGDPFWARFSWIHLLTVLTAVGLISGTARLLIGGPKLKKHSGPFIGAFIGGLVIAGFFAFMPGRMMHDILFGTCKAGFSDKSVCEKPSP